MKFNDWCDGMKIQGKWKTKLRQALNVDGRDAEDETVFAHAWNRIIKPNPSVSKYAISKRLGISRQAVGQWKNFDNSDKNQTAVYLRNRAVKTRDRGLVALDLAKNLGETAVFYSTMESDGQPLSPKDIGNRLSRSAQHVVKWGIDLSPSAVVEHCINMQKHNAALGQAYIDRANGMITIAREIEEGKW